MTTRDFTGKQVAGRYLLSSRIGTGVAGSVYRAVDTTLAQSPVYAVKCVELSEHRRRWRQQIDEFFNHNRVSHCPNILKMYDAIEEKGHYFFVLAMCESDLFKAIWEKRVYFGNDALIKEVFVDILAGVSGIHKKGVFHRDLKPENIMCDAFGTNVQIGDFGLSTSHRVCADRCGTYAYLAPECWDRNFISYYADLGDVWALGVILFSMVTCMLPWEEAHWENKEYRAFSSDKDYLLSKYWISESLDALLHRIWHPNPKRRMSISAIRKAIVEMDTFYDLPETGNAARVEEGLSVADSQQTCVAALEEDKLKADGELDSIRPLL